MNRYARVDDKEKLRMAKNLVKSNNKKIKKALDHINRFLAEKRREQKRITNLSFRYNRYQRNLRILKKDYC